MSLVPAPLRSTNFVSKAGDAGCCSHLFDTPMSGTLLTHALCAARDQPLTLAAATSGTLARQWRALALGRPNLDEFLRDQCAAYTTNFSGVLSTVTKTELSFVCIWSSLRCGVRVGFLSRGRVRSRVADSAMTSAGLALRRHADEHRRIWPNCVRFASAIHVR